MDLDDRLGLGEAARHVAGAGLLAPGAIVPPAVVHDRRRRHDGRGRHRQRLVVDDDRGGAVGGAIGIVGHDHRDRLADVPHALAGHHGMHVGGPVRLADQRRHRGCQLGSLANGEDAQHTGQSERRRAVDAEHSRVRVWAAHEHQMHHGRQPEIVDVAAGAGEESPVFLALGRGADHDRVEAPSDFR